VYPAPANNVATVVEKTGGDVPTAQTGNEQTNTISLKQQTKLEDIDIPIETEEYTAVFTTRGAALKSFMLKKYRETIEKNSARIELVIVKPGMLHPLTTSFAGSNFEIPDDAIYEVKIDGPNERYLTFILEYPGTVKIEKTYKFYPGKYNFDLEVKVTNLSQNALSQLVGLNWCQFVDPKAPTDRYGHEGPVSLVAKNIEREEVKKMTTSKTIGPNVYWGGFESKYFISAMIAQNPSLTSFSFNKDNQEMVSLNMTQPKSVIPPGQSSLLSYSLYLGPKDYSILKALKAGLENSIDFGNWLKLLAMPLLLILKFLHGNVIANYGIAIIILTALIKIIFWPLGNKSYQSMKEMQKLQPKMVELREKYKDDKARISQEIMALYKAHKVNPMGGCLPMIIQIPVFFGLYKTLLYAIELRHSPFIWWVQDLSAKDPYYVTPIIMGATMFIQQKMTPPAGDPMQAKIMLFMPIIFTVMFLNFPSGLVIYWLFNNIISIGQQYYINKLTS
jgi:YidC/Oxa1 family membrane protein insertase